MAYCTVDDLKKLLPESMLINLSNDSVGATTIQADNAAEAIDQADREIDCYLNIAGYSVPIDPVPPLIANLSAKISIWNLHLRKYFDSEIWRNTYKDCLKLLERIAEGRLTLGQTQETIQEPAPMGGSTTVTRSQKFSSDLWEMY